MNFRFRKGRWRKKDGTKKEEEIYADHIVMLADNEEEMAGLNTALGKYLSSKKLRPNTDNTKIMMFRKGQKKLTA